MYLQHVIKIVETLKWGFGLIIMNNYYFDTNPEIVKKISASP